MHARLLCTHEITCMISDDVIATAIRHIIIQKSVSNKALLSTSGEEGYMQVLFWGANFVEILMSFL